MPDGNRPGALHLVDKAGFVHRDFLGWFGKVHSRRSSANCEPLKIRSIPMYFSTGKAWNVTPSGHNYFGLKLRISMKETAGFVMHAGKEAIKTM